MSDIVYYNATIANPIYVPTDDDPSPSPNNYTLADYKASLGRNIVDKGSDYYGAIVRFTIPASNIPIFIYKLKDKTLNANGYYNNPLTGIYGVALYYDDGVTQYTASANTQYTPDYTVSGSSEQTNRAYYYVRDYQHMLNMINTAYTTAFSDLSGHVTLPAGVTTAPWISFDPATQLFTFNVQQSYLTGNHVQCWMNIYLYNMFQSFGGFTNVYNGVPATDNKDYRIKINDLGDNRVTGANIPGTSSTTDIYKMTQQYKNLYRWNDARSVAFVSNSFPIVGEVVPSYSTDNYQSSYSAKNILTDFEFNVSDGPEVVSDLQYVPQSQWRWFQMNSYMPVNQIDFSIYWIDQNGVEHQIFIPPGDSITVKFAFYKKELVKGSYSTRFV